jgi:hypothetical protein
VHGLQWSQDEHPLPDSEWPNRRRMFVKLFAFRRPSETETQFGGRLALSGPILCYTALLLGMLIWRVEGEAGLGMTFMYWLFIGLTQLVPPTCLSALRSGGSGRHSRRALRWVAL